MRSPVVVIVLLAARTALGATYHVDCAAGSDAAEGTTAETAWRTTAKVSATTFSPGDAVLVRRGTRCPGMLWPKGSGDAERPIRLGNYGRGVLPVIDGGAEQAAVKLYNQQGWEIDGLETAGGSPYGLYIGGDAGRLKHFRVRNAVVHDVGGEVKAKDSGLVVVLADGAATIEDVVIDGVVAHHTTQWAGVIVRGASRENRIRDVTVRNTIVHDVFGDGIVLFQVENGLIEKSAAWLTGLQPVQTIGTPNGIWTWRCRKCTVQWTEGFFTDSPGVDGGVYDIDWGCDDNVVQHNYGHDAMGYCLSVFGAEKETTTNSVVRYNVCVNNGRSPKLARRQGDLYISTWAEGALDGVVIHNNTFYWNPPIDAPALQMDHAEFSGARPNLFANNVVVSKVPSLVHSSRRLELKGNVYWYDGRGEPAWSYGGTRAARPPTGDSFVPPVLDERLRPRKGSPLVDAALGVTTVPTDAFGSPLPRGAKPDVGAIELADPLSPLRAPPDLALRDVDGEPVSLTDRGGRWLLLVAGRPGAEARSQLVFVKAAVAQYGRGALEAAIWLEGADPDLRHDWELGGVRLVTSASARERLHLAQPVGTLLVSPAGQVVRAWDGFVAPAELGLSLRRALGPPPGSPPLAAP